MLDSFQAAGDALLAPARAPFAITPSDGSALPVLPKALYVGTGGTLVLRGVDFTASSPRSRTGGFPS